VARARERERERESRACDERAVATTHTYACMYIHAALYKKLVPAFIRDCERAIKQIRMEFHDEKGSASAHERSEIARNAQSMKKLHFNASLLRN